MSDVLVPEMHDGLKLTRLAHNLSDFTFAEHTPRTKTWQGVLQHHISEKFPCYPVEPETFLLCIADNLAASVSRPVVRMGLGPGRFQIYKLWNPPESREDPRLHKDEDIKRLLDFYAQDPPADKFFKEYGDILKRRNEDANPGRNITSLFTHSKLTGQFYNILTSISGHLKKEDFIGTERKNIQEMLNEAQNSWKLTVCKCKFHFHQRPIRPRDLNVFAKLEQLLQEIESNYNKNVLFRTSDEMLLVVAEKTTLENMFERAFESGFWVETVVATRCLHELRADPEKMPGVELENKYPSLPEHFNPPICEICQMAKATKHWARDYILESMELCEACRELVSTENLSDIEDQLCKRDLPKITGLEEERAQEDLCDNCFTIRALGINLLKLKDWAKDRAAKIAWVKVRLDFNSLVDTLQDLFLDFLRTFDGSIAVDKAQIRFSVINEFQEDYNAFLNAFYEKLKRVFSDRNIERVLSDLYCIKLERYSDVLKILHIYKDLLTALFPVFKKLKTAPLKIISVCCDSKFPFFEVWRVIDTAKDSVHISLIGHGEIKTTNRALDQMLLATDARKFRKSALHNLAEVAKISEKLAELRFSDKSDRDYKTYTQLKETLPLGMDFQSVLTFSKLIGD